MRKYDAFFFYYVLALVVILFVEAFLTSLSPHAILLPFVLIPILIFLWINLKRPSLKPIVVKEQSAPHLSKSEQASHIEPIMVKKKQKSQTVMIVLGAIGMLGVYGVLAYRAFSQPSLSQLLDEQIAISKEITNIKEEVSSLFDVQETNTISNEDLKQIKEEIAKYQKSELTDKEILSILGATTTSFSSNSAGTNEQSNQSKQRYVTIKSTQGLTLDVYAEKYSSSKVLGQMKQGITYSSPMQDGNYFMIELGNDIKGWVNGQYLKEI